MIVIDVIEPFAGGATALQDAGELPICRVERVAEQERKVPEAPSMTPEERIQARAERRAAAEKKRAENIKKRAEKAAEYERQVKLREEQKKNSVTGDLVPRL